MVRFIFLSAAVTSLLCGCASVPDLGPVPALRDAASFPAEAALAGPRGEWPVEGWWRSFGDPALDALIEEGLRGSPDVALAAARVRAADALAQQAGAALLPRVGAEAGAGVTQQSRNMGIPPQFVPEGIQSTGHVAATLSFDLDLWGRNRAALAAATSEAQAAAVDAAQARLILTTAIAAAYADLSGYYAGLDVAREAADIRAASAAITAQRTGAGLDNRGTQRQAESRVPAARAEVLALEEAIALTHNRIAALIGAGPDRGLSIARPRLAALPLGIPPSAGIDLIGRRPDVVAARLRAEAAASRIRSAKAEFYPNVSLSALAGIQSLGLSNLFTADSAYGNAGAAITLPLFEGGRLEGRYRGTRAEYDSTVARYGQTLIAALREVADALASRNATERRLAEQRAALSAANEAVNLAGLRYRAGLTNQLVQLTAQDSAIATSRSVAELEARRKSLDVALIRALGGGYQAAPLTGER